MTAESGDRVLRSIAGACCLFAATLIGCGDASPRSAATAYTQDVTEGHVEEPTDQVSQNVPSPAASLSSLNSTVAPATIVSAADPAPRFRLPDDRPKLNREELLAEGLRIVESKHLILVTDLPLETVTDLPPLADALFATLEQRLGKLAPDKAEKPFQVTGYVMDARDRFERVDLLPPEQYPIRHGRNLGYQFWMNNQTADYYRRHLMLHEFVHCFLMCEYGMQDIPPLWYTEGIAEYFATHQLHEDVTQSQFGILPASVDGFEGWHRIVEIQRTFNLNPSAEDGPPNFVPLQTVLHPPDAMFLEDSQYAHAWALVWLIHHHPELQTIFAPLADCRTRLQFEAALAEVPESTWMHMDQVWPLYLDGLKEADVAAVRFPAMRILERLKSDPDNSLPAEFELNANEQWISTGLRLTAGQEIRIECKGRYVVEETTKLWFSEPDGITIDYVHGSPLGQVLGAIVSTDGTHATRRIPLGIATTLKSPIDGILWLQVNDDWSKRDKNNGSVTVSVATRNE
jgi:hypothetical protein